MKVRHIMSIEWFKWMHSHGNFQLEDGHPGAAEAFLEALVDPNGSNYCKTIRKPEGFVAMDDGDVAVADVDQGLVVILSTEEE